jgi:hypothetical protein
MFKKIYKKILIIFFNFFNKKLIVLDDKKKKNDINTKIFKADKRKYKIYEIKNGKIFTNSVDDAAYISKNYLLQGPSYQYRNSINKNINENYVLKNGTPKIIKKFSGNILSIISGGAAKHNYGHWIYDVLSRILVFKKVYSLKIIDYFYLPNYKLKFQKETLALLGIKKSKIIDSEEFKYIKGNRIYATNHPSIHRFNNISSFVIKEIRKNLFKKVATSFNKKINYKKIYIERDYSKFDLKGDIKKYRNERILINNSEISLYLKRNGFQIIQLKNMTFANQARLFNEANIIVSMFGAEMSNIMFCKPKTRIIEITNKSLGLSDYTNISKICRLKHIQIKLKPIYYTKVKQNGIIMCPVNQLKKKLY